MEAGGGNPAGKLPLETPLLSGRAREVHAGGGPETDAEYFPEDQGCGGSEVIGSSSTGRNRRVRISEAPI